MSEAKTRRIPMDDDFNWDIDDILYGWYVLQATFNPETKTLYLTAKNEREARTRFKQDSGVHAKTVLRRRQRLLDYGYMELDDCGNYIFPADSKKWEIVDYSMLEYLVTTRNENCIKVYCYLLNKHKWKTANNELYSFTLGELAKMLGYSDSSSMSGSITRGMGYIVESLRREGIIDYVEYRDEQKHPHLRLVNVIQKKEELKD